MGVRGYRVKTPDSKPIVPNLLGSHFFNVSDYLEKAGLKLGSVLYEESEADNNIVFHQSVEPGETAESGEKIDVKVAGQNPLRFLPSIYQSNDIKSGGFLKRYLWIIQSIIAGINGKLDNIDRYFNPLEAPGDFYKWIATWFSVNLEYDIPEYKMRLLVKEAVKLYRWRGTALGISKYLEIVTGVKPEIIDHDIPIDEFIIADHATVERPIVGEHSSLYNFTVYFPVRIDHFDLETIKKIHQIVKLEKPAHANYFIVFAREEQKSGKNFATIDVDFIP
jgi:phage tail-like protein